MILTFKNKRFSLNSVLLTLLVWSIACFAYDKYNIKIFLLFITLAYNLETIINEVIDFRRNKIIDIFAIIFPMYLIISSALIRGGFLVDAIKGVYVCFFLLLVFVFKKENFDICEAIYQIMSFLAIVVVFIGLADMLKFIDLYTNPLVVFLENINEGMISRSDNAIFYYVIFIKTSPFFIFNLLYCLEKKRYYMAVISVWAIMWTGTRAIIYLSLILIVVYYIFIVNNKSRSLIFVWIAAIIVTLGYEFFINKVELINFAKNEGDNVRTLIIPSIINALNKNKIYWIFGMGIGSKYYSLGRHAYLYGEEIAYIEFLRSFGLIACVFLFIFLVLPIKRIFKSNYRWVLLPYFAFLINSTVDPFLFTSTSFLMYLIVYDIYINKIKS